MTTVNGILTPLRIRLDEISAHEWANADQLITYISNAERWLAGLLSDLPGCGLFRVRDVQTVSANATTLAITSLTSTATKVFYKARNVSMLLDGLNWTNLHQLDEDDENNARNIALSGGGVIVPRWRLFGTDFQFLPARSTATSCAVSYQWIPIVKTSTSDTIETPAMEDDLLVLRAAFSAMADRRESNEALNNELAQRLQDAVARYQGRQYGSRGERVRARTTRLLYR